MIKARISSIIILALMLASFSAVYAQPQPSPPPIIERPLIAGQNYLVGKVEIRRDSNYVHFEYKVLPEYRLTEVHLHYGDTLDDFPLTKKGSPKVGKFMYSEEFVEEVMSYKFSIPWLEAEVLPKLWAAHAVVIGVSENAEFEEETAWAKGEQFDGKDWSMYFKLKYVILKIGPSFDQEPVGYGDSEGIDVWNFGTGVAHNVQLVMQIPEVMVGPPPGFPLTAFIIQQVEPEPDSHVGPIVTWNLGDIEPGTHKGVSFKVYKHKEGSFTVLITASCSEASMTINPTIVLI